MTARRRPAAWLMIAALSAPVAPLLFAAQADEPAPVPAASDEGDAPKPTAQGQPKGSATSRPTTRARQKPGATTRADGAADAAPTTRPTRELSAEEMLSQMLKPPAAGGNRPLPPLPEVSAGGPDKTSGEGAVAPDAPVVNVLREGTFLVDRVGRIERSTDGSQAEFVFESDGTALQDPPVVIIPNLKLMQMEDAAANSTRDLRFRVSGMVTEYRGRNYVLLEKVVVVPEVLERF